MTEHDVPEKWRHLRPQTIAVLRGQGFHDPRENEFGALAPSEKGLTGEICTSIAYSPRSAEDAAAMFEGVKHGYIYARLSRGTPPIAELSRSLLDFELCGSPFLRDKYDVLLTSTGMAAIDLVAKTLADNGREFISSPCLYGGTYHLFTALLPRLNIRCHMVEDPFCLDAWYRAADDHPNATFFFAEDDANPLPRKLHNSAIAAIARSRGMYYVCDRTVGTSILEQPLLSGADVVLHSLSKNPGGESRGLGGCLIGRKEIIKQARDRWFSATGPILDARVADYFLFGLRTLRKRMTIKRATAGFIAGFLRGHPKVKRVYGPGGDLLAFEINGTLGDAKRFVESLKLVIFAPHLGHIRSLAVHPASTTHAQMPRAVREKQGISDSLIRISVGLEDKEDIRDDLEQALALIP